MSGIECYVEKHTGKVEQLPLRCLFPLEVQNDTELVIKKFVLSEKYLNIILFP